MFLKLGDIEQGLQHFPKGTDSFKPSSDYSEPSDWASAAQFKVNYNLLVLNASWISWMPLHEVKDLISKVHILITKLTQKNWPDYNYIPDPLNLDRPIGGRLDWHYYGCVEEIRPFLEDEPGKALHTLVRIFQRVVLQRKTSPDDPNSQNPFSIRLAVC